MQQFASSPVILPRRGTRLSRNLLANKPVERRDILVLPEQLASDFGKTNEFACGTQANVQLVYWNCFLTNGPIG